MGEKFFYTREEMYEIYPYLEVLEKAVSTLPEDAVVVELGCWSGKATCAMLFASKAGHKIVAIDHFGGTDNAVERSHFDVMREKLGEVGFDSPKDLFLESVKNVPGRGQVFLNEDDFDNAAGSFPPESIDMIFIDGNHVSAMHDMLVWVPRVKKGGRVFVHDVNCPHFTVAEEFQIFCEYYGFDWDMDYDLGCFTK